MQAVPGDRVARAAGDAGLDVLDLHDIERAQLVPFVVGEQIDIGIWPGFVAGGGAEEIKLLNTEAAEFCLVRFEQGVAVARSMGWK